MRWPTPLRLPCWYVRTVTGCSTAVRSTRCSATPKAALGVVGDGLVQDLQVKLDAAFFADTTTVAGQRQPAAQSSDTHTGSRK